MVRGKMKARSHHKQRRGLEKLFLLGLVVVLFLVIAITQVPYFQLLSSVEHTIDENISYHAPALNDLEVNIKEKTNESKIITFNDSEGLIAEVEIPVKSSGSIGKVTNSRSIATGAAVFHTEAEQIDEQEKAIYIPREDRHTRVRICEGATSTDQVYDGCIQEDDVTDEYILRRGDSRLETTADGAFWKVLGISGTGGVGENISVDCYAGVGELSNLSLCDLNHFNFSLTIVSGKTGDAQMTNISRNAENGAKKSNALHDKTSELYVGDIINLVAQDENAVFRDFLYLNRFMFLYNISGTRYNLTTENALLSSCTTVSTNVTESQIDCSISNNDVNVTIEHKSWTRNTKPLIFYRVENIGANTLEQIQVYNYYDFDVGEANGKETRDDYMAIIIHSDESTTEEQIQKEGTVVCDSKGIPNEIDLSACSDAAGDSFILRQQKGSGVSSAILVGGISTQFSSAQQILVEEAFANPSTDSDGVREIPPELVDASGSTGVLNSADAVTALSITAGSLSPGEKFQKSMAPVAASSNTDFITLTQQSTPGEPLRIENVAARDAATNVITNQEGAYSPLNITVDLSNTGGFDLVGAKLYCNVTLAENEIYTNEYFINSTASDPTITYACGSLLNQDNSLDPGTYDIMFTLNDTFLVENATGTVEILSDFNGSINSSIANTTRLCHEDTELHITVFNDGNTLFTGDLTVDLYSQAGSFIETVETISNFQVAKNAQNSIIVQKTVTECSDIPQNYTLQASFKTTDLADGVESMGINATYMTDDIQAPSVTLLAPDNTSYNNTNTMPFQWIAEDNNDLSLLCNVSIDESVSESDIASTNGSSTSTSVGPLTEGVHTWNMACADNVNNVGISETRTFTIDLTNPSVSSITNSDADNVVLSSDSITLNATIIDTNLDASSITIGNESSVAMSLVSDNMYSVTTTASSLGCVATDGLCILTVTASDLAGNSNLTEKLTLTIDDVNPSVTSLSSNDADGIVKSTDSVTYSVTVTDTNTLASVTLGNESSVAMSNTEGNTYQVTTSANSLGCVVSDGSCILTVTATDIVGHVNNSEQLTLTIDDVNPSVSSITNSDADNLVSSTDSITLYATITDTNLDVSTITVGNESSVAMSLVSDNMYSVTTTASSLGCVATDGACVLTMTATDDASNTNNSEQLTLTIDDVNPSVSSLSSNDADNLIQSFDSVMYSVTVTDTNSLTSVTLGNESSVVMSDVGGNTYQVTTSANSLGCIASDGACILTVTATDLLGNTNSTEVITMMIDDVNPSVSSLSSNDADNLIQSFDSVTYSVTVTDTNSLTSVTLGNESSTLMSNSEGNTYQVTTSASSLGCTSNDGACILTVTATDLLGNTNSTEVITMMIDDVNPSVSSLSSNDADDIVKSTDSVMYSVTVTDTNSLSSVTLGNESSVVMSDVGGNTYQVTTSASSLGCTAIDGSCILTVTATDSFGHINNSEQLTLTIDLTNPSVSSITNSDVDNIVLSSDSITLNATVTDTNLDASTITIGNESSVVMSLVSDNMYSVTTTASSLGCVATDGSCILTVIASDLVGNSNATEQLTLAVDDVSPSVASFLANESLVNIGQQINFTVQITESNTISSILLNGSTMDDKGSGLYSFSTNANAIGCTVSGSCEVFVEVTDIVSNQNNSESVSFTVDASNPAFSQDLQTLASGVTYAAANNYHFNITVSEDQEISTVLFEWDGINYSTNLLVGTTYGINRTDLAAGTYNYKWYATDSTENTGESSGIYTVTQATPTMNLTLTPDTQVDYPSETNASCSSDVAGLSVNLYEDDSLVSNPHSDTLTIDTYEYVCNTAGNTNYSAASTSQNLSVLNLGAKMSSLAQIEFVLVSDPSKDVSVHKQTGVQEVYVQKKSNGFVVGKMTVDFSSLIADLDMSGLVIDYNTNSKKGVLHKNSYDSSISTTKTLYIPYSGTPSGEVYICPGAETIDGVFPGCASKVTLHEGQNTSGMNFSYVEISGQKYYEVMGVTGTGGGEGNAPYLTNPLVLPSSGSLDTVYQFTVTYTDDENDSAGTVITELDASTNYTMTEIDSEDTDVTDGKLYEVNLTGSIIGENTPSVVFYANDTANANAATNSATGPTVTPNAQVATFDDSDTSTVYSRVTFSLHANYTQTSGQTITSGGGGECFITIAAASVTNDAMTFNGTGDGTYNYTTRINSAGNHAWSANCTSLAYDDLSTSDTADITENPDVPEFGGLVLLPTAILLAIFVQRKIALEGGKK